MENRAIQKKLYIIIIVIICVVFSGAKKGGSVGQWLTDLRSMTEIECMSVLQGKPLQTEGRQSDPSIAVNELKGEKGDWCFCSYSCSITIIVIAILINILVLFLTCYYSPFKFTFKFKNILLSVEIIQILERERDIFLHSHHCFPCPCH